MATKNLKAIPTEYKGVRYRSKSEAMFAAFLDSGGHRFGYEPHWLQTDDMWTPDFVFGFASTSANLYLFVVEYKPKVPTDTYFNTASSRVGELLKKHTMLPLCFMVATGSLFDSSVDRSVYAFNQRSGEWERTYNADGFYDWDSWFGGDLEYARTYRYDLIPE